MFMFQRLLEGRPEVLCVRVCVLAFAFGLPFALGLPASAGAEEAHAIAMHGKPAMPADFTHMPYVNPDAPKGGRLTWGVLGT